MYVAPPTRKTFALFSDFVSIGQQVPGNTECNDRRICDGLGICRFSVRVHGGYHVAARETTHEYKVTRLRAALLRCFHSTTVTATFIDNTYRR